MDRARGRGGPRAADPDPRRRALLAGGGALVAGLALPRARAAPLRTLEIWGPPGGPSVTVAHAIAAGLLRPIADKATLRVWRNPDEMRAGLTSGALQVGVMPTTAAANMHTRGLGVALLNVLTAGLLYVVAADRSIDGFGALAGRTLAVPFRNDTPDLLLGRLLRDAGLRPGRDLQLHTAGTPVEAIQLLLAGRVDAALVPEPAASAAVVRGAAAGQTLERVIDVQRQWARVRGREGMVPQAGLAVTDTFVEVGGAHLDALHQALVAATAAVRADPARAASDAAAALGMPWPVIEQAIAHSNLVAVRAAQARADLEALFSLLAGADPRVIGGRLPGPAFYL